MPESLFLKKLQTEGYTYLNKPRLKGAGLSMYDVKPATLLKKKTLAQVCSCEFCKTFKNTFIMEHLRTTASASPSLFDSC